MKIEGTWQQGTIKNCTITLQGTTIYVNIPGRGQCGQGGVIQKDPDIINVTFSDVNEKYIAVLIDNDQIQWCLLTQQKQENIQPNIWDRSS